MGEVGIDPDKYWDYTLRECKLIANAWESSKIFQLENIRYIAYSNFASTVGGMDGKPVFKKIKSPMDLFPLRSDKKEEGISDKEAEAFMNSIVKK